MDFVDLRGAGADLRAAVLALNAEHVVETAPLDRPGLDALLGACRVALGLASGRALVLAIGPGAAYESANYRWVSERYAEFLYIDRVIVGRELQGTGVGRALYRGVFDAARAWGVPVLCEVNQRPPNPSSDAFHAVLGFEAIGRGTPSPDREVQYLRWRP